jgi:hypothetical protein
MRPPLLPGSWRSPGRRRRTALWSLGGLAVAFFVAQGILDLELQDRGSGIIAFEVAGSEQRAGEILDEWGGDGRATARAQLWIDYPYLVCIALFVSLACVAVADGIRSRPGLAAAGAAIAWLPLAAGVFDASENAALLVMLGSGAGQPAPAIALGAATMKYVCGVGAALYLLAGLAVRSGERLARGRGA